MNNPNHLAKAYREALDRRYKALAIETQFMRPTDSEIVAIRMEDRIEGIVVQEHGLDIPTTKPAVAIRNADLAALGLRPSDMIGIAFSFRGQDWRVKTTQPKPGPFGVDSDQTFLILIQV